jgi:alpha-glucan, water dikinase
VPGPWVILTGGSPLAFDQTITTQSGVVLAVSSRIEGGAVEASIRMDRARHCILHWGVRLGRHSAWQLPPRSSWPEGSRSVNDLAVQTPFPREDGAPRITIRLDRDMGASSVDFVLYFPDEGRWDNNSGRNYRIAVPEQEAPPGPGASELEALVSTIIDREMGSHSWTLMHRFNLCYDLVSALPPGSSEAISLIFVWLRYSAIRQLDWQRDYNTKPRELSHALDRLTQKLAERYLRNPAERGLIRLALTTLGRGGSGAEGQRIRDEVLNIMHRHHIKEVAGHFMEEWHQKLHNNTTPDDIVIAEAYLEFLRSNGALDRFYARLARGGVTRDRLRSYERPIRSDPDFIPPLKNVLIHDFEDFLGVLKSVHEGTDLGASIDAARYLFDDELAWLVNEVWAYRGGRGISTTDLAVKVAGVLARVAGRLDHEGAPGPARDLLFLDLALEQFLRIVVERDLSSSAAGDRQVDLMGPVLDVLGLSPDLEGLLPCARQWARLRQMPRSDRLWVLEAKAVLDRVSLVIGCLIDRVYATLQPKAALLGRAFEADEWTIDLFSEEVIRGQPIFAASALARGLDPVLRRTAHLGDWQVISPGEGAGRIEVADELASFHASGFAAPTIIVTNRVSGNEEIPERTTAILTSAVVDVLSHVAVRARNAGVLFATCHDAASLERLRARRGQMVGLKLTGAGDVVQEEAPPDRGEPVPAASATPREGRGGPRAGRPARTTVPTAAVRTSLSTVLLEPEFDPGRTGGKACNLRRLRGELPGWIGLPVSVALPFGVCEKVLAEEANRDSAARYEEVAGRIDAMGGEERDRGLRELREILGGLTAPSELMAALEATMRRAGLPWPQNPGEAWKCITGVWGSKWNDRAYFSRRARGLRHEDLFMAVLIQGVVEAEYGYVIHTVNPVTRDEGDLYGEVVLGLGETLVGSHPGRALSFSARKADPVPNVLGLPSKSTALIGGGLIFRSDSSGEDLAGYAGAGLYDSLVLPPPRSIVPDYTDEPLLRDGKFRDGVLAGIAAIGTMIESRLGSPQDIEGVYARGRFTVVQSRPQVGID